jgi:hypothetical protein
MYDESRTAFISREAFARSMGVSLATLNRGRKTGLYPFNRCVKLNKRVLYPVSLLAELQERVKDGLSIFGGEE